MKYVAQGTVQVRQRAGGKVTLVLINPISDYMVRHKRKEYVVLVGNKRAVRMFPVQKTYKLDNSLGNAAWQAALDGTKIEVELEVKGAKATVISLRIPATAPRL